MAAVTWGFAVILYKKSGETVHPIGLNLFKNLLAMVLFLPTMWLMGDTLIRDVPYSEYLLMFVSGMLGIGLSDTLYFMSLNRIGAGLSAIVDCLYSPFIIGLSILWLGEELSVLQIIGAILIISAVLAGTSERGKGGIHRKNILWGLVFGVLAMATMAVGIVMIKPLLDRSPILWVTEVRLVGGIIVLILVLILHPGRRRMLSSIYSVHSWKYTLSGSFVGTYLAMILWLAGMKFTEASIAAALNQTSNIFVFAFAAIFLKDAINARRMAGIVLGITGVFIVMFG